MRCSPFICLLAVGLLSSLQARHVAVSPLPVSAFADTEATTNLPFGQDAATREVKLRFTIEGSPSNCIQVAFGRDADEDGNLGFDETEALFGWRNGRYFAEEVCGGMRLEEPAAPGEAAHVLDIAMKLSGTEGAPRLFSATDETGAAVFASLAAARPGWLHSFGWNLMRVTRRGPGRPEGWFFCDLRANPLRIRMR